MDTASVSPEKDTYKSVVVHAEASICIDKSPTSECYNPTLLGGQRFLVTLRSITLISAEGVHAPTISSSCPPGFTTLLQEAAIVAVHTLGNSSVEQAGSVDLELNLVIHKPMVTPQAGSPSKRIQSQDFDFAPDVL